MRDTRNVNSSKVWHDPAPPEIKINAPITDVGLHIELVVGVVALEMKRFESRERPATILGLVYFMELRVKLLSILVRLESELLPSLAVRENCPHELRAFGIVASLRKQSYDEFLLFTSSEINLQL